MTREEILKILQGSRELLAPQMGEYDWNMFVDWDTPVGIWEDAAGVEISFLPSFLKQLGGKEKVEEVLRGIFGEVRVVEREGGAKKIIGAIRESFETRYDRPYNNLSGHLYLKGRAKEVYIFESIGKKGWVKKDKPTFVLEVFRIWGNNISKGEDFETARELVVSFDGKKGWERYLEYAKREIEGIGEEGWRILMSLLFKGNKWEVEEIQKELNKK